MPIEDRLEFCKFEALTGYGYYLYYAHVFHTKLLVGILFGNLSGLIFAASSPRHEASLLQLQDTERVGVDRADVYIDSMQKGLRAEGL